MKSTIYLFRHSLTQGNLGWWYYGSLNLPLVQEGIDKVVRLAAEGIYPNPAYSRIYTSGMLRAEMTLEAMYGMKLPHEVLPEMQEFKFGAWEGLTHEELSQIPEGVKFLEDETGDYQIPGGGESTKQFRDRIDGSWQKLLKLHRLNELSLRGKDMDVKTIVVAHGGAINRIMHITFGEPGEEPYRWMPETAHGFAIEIENGEPVSYTAL